MLDMGFSLIQGIIQVFEYSTSHTKITIAIWSKKE
jgi:hypothetical protein